MLRLWRRRLSAPSSPLELLEVPPPPSAPSRAGGEDSGVSLEARGVVVCLSRGFDEGTPCRVMGLLPDAAMLMFPANARVFYCPDPDSDRRHLQGKRRGLRKVAPGRHGKA